MRNFGSYGLALVLLVLAALSAVQMHSLRDTNARLAALETRLAELQPVSDFAALPGNEPLRVDRNDFNQRLLALENTISHLTPATNRAPSRGQGAVTATMLEELRRKLLDPAMADKDRLQALRLLRRNKGMDDAVLQSALSWLQSSQDGDTRREILQHLDGYTNAALRQPLLDLAMSSADAKTRQEAVENLRHFMADAEVEKQLWDSMQKDPDPKVRERAEEALREGPMTAERTARLQQRAMDPQADLNQRLTAMRALVKGGADGAEAAASIVALAQNTQDPVARANIYRAVDGVRDPRLLPPLLGGLQDPSPDVRQEATEALSKFASDPNIRQWLEYVAQSDADPKVKREAFQALKKLQDGSR